MVTKTFWLLLSLLLSGAAFAHEAPHAHSAASAVQGALQPVAARFELKIKQTKTDWYLWREVDSVEMADLAAGQSKIWERSGQADYSYQRVFHNDQRIVEYTPGEIRTRHAAPDWAQLSSVVSPQLLTTLKRGASKTLFGQQAVQYSGVVDGQSIKLWWLEKAQLPAQLVIRSNKQNLDITLKEMHPQAPAAWPRATESKIAHYAKIDAADFGDMERDPFVARVMQMDGHQHSH